MRKQVIAMALMTMLAIWLPAVCMQSPAAQKDRGSQKVIHDPVEYRAYFNALNIKDPNQRGAAMEAFAYAYPDSVVKIDALEQAVAAYQQAGNNGKLDEITRRILVMQPNNLRALAIITYRERSGLMPDLPSICLHARRGLQEMATWQKPENLGEAEFHELRSQMEEIFYGAAGDCSFWEKNFKAARDAYSKAVQVNPRNLQNLFQLGASALEMNPPDVNGLWYIAKAINLAQVQGKPNATATVTVKANMESYGKAKYRKYHGGEDGWDQLVSAAALQTSLPSEFASGVKAAPTPPELAVLAMQKNSPESFSLSDLEFILQFRNVSPANKSAADSAWAIIQSRQKNGQVKIRIPDAKVISSNAGSMDVAATNDKKNANQADVHLILERNLLHPPDPGSTIEISGVFTGYSPQPFMFTMEQGGLPGMTHSELSEADIEKLLHGSVTPKRATELVRQKGVDFDLDSQAKRRLEQAGATKELLQAIAAGRK